MKNLTLIFLLTSLTFASVVYAEDLKQPKFRSETTARVLSLMPLNSPALFYANRPVRGIIYTILETGGMVLMAGGIDMIVKNEFSCGSEGDFCMNSGVIGAIITPIGFAYFFPPWLHTVIKTPDYLDDYNDKIRKKNAVSIASIFTTTGEKQIYGLGFQYRF